MTAHHDKPLFGTLLTAMVTPFRADGSVDLDSTASLAQRLVDSDPQGSLGGVEVCDAASYRNLVGQPVAATTFPAGPRLRVYSDSDVVTQEYLPNRTNIVYDDSSGVILRVFCG